MSDHKAHQSCADYRDRASARLARERGARGRGALEAMRAQKDGAYHERDRVVALAARMAAILHWPAWLGQHEDKPGDAPWDADWRNIVFIRLPSGQVSWHIHDSELPLVRFLPGPLSSVAEPWDGHSTEEKYRRCDAPWPPPSSREERPTCTNNAPREFSGHWREWHRGHGCDKDPEVNHA